MNLLQVPQSGRYFPLIPCPWRHDPSIKPTISNHNRIDIGAERRFMEEYWNVDFTLPVNRHVLFDLDSWYLHALGLFPFDLPKLYDKAEQAVQKLLSNQPLSSKEKFCIRSVYLLPPNNICRQAVEKAEEAKLQKVGKTFIEAVRSEPFHLRHLAKIPEIKTAVVTKPVDQLQMPHAFAVTAVADRTYTAMENQILDALLRP